jgi:hypothetical protein
VQHVPLVPSCEFAQQVDTRVLVHHPFSATVLKSGSRIQVRDGLRHRCLEALAESSPTGQRARSLREQAEALSARVQQAELDLMLSETRNNGAPRRQVSAVSTSAPTPEVINGMRTKVENLRGQSEALLREAAAGVLQHVQVVACTCAGEPPAAHCRHHDLTQYSFVDEAQSVHRHGVPYFKLLS